MNTQTALPELPFFAPHLTLTNVAAGIDLYKKAFGAIELRRWSNPDGSVHVAEMTIGKAMFHLHEEVQGKKQLSPKTVNATTLLIGLFVDDPDALMNSAVKAGCTESSAIQDYDYGYRQGEVTDPFGHQWLIQKRI